MDRPIQKKDALTARTALLILFVVAASLACNGNGISDEKLAGINRGEPFEPITNLFNDTANKPQNKQANTNAEVKPGDGPAFFDIPSNWKLTRADENAHVYQLKHNQNETASVMISYEEIDAPVDEQKARLRQSHENVVGKLPSSFKQQEYREWMVDERPHIHTTLAGRAAEDKPEMIISGYSIAIGADTYTVFAAYNKSDASKLSNDIDAVVKSLRPLPEPSEEGEEDTSTEPTSPEASDEPESEPEEETEPEEPVMEGSPPPKS